MKSTSIGLSFLITVFFPLQGCWASDPATDSHADKQPSPNASRSNAPSESGYYKLVKDGVKELCELNPLLCDKPKDLCSEIEKNFNSFPDVPPMVCVRKYNSELGFTTPDWEPIPKEQIDWEILRQIYFSKNENRFSEEGLKETWPEEKTRLQALAEKQTILWSAEFDIDNKEGRERVLMLRDNTCSVDKYLDYNAPDPSLHVLEGSGGDISEAYKRLNSHSFDVFMYKGHTFLSAWKGLELEHSNAQLYVYTAFNPQGRLGFSSKYGCTFKYIQ